MSDYIPILLSSAAIGALVSSGITLFAQRAERQARRREMLLAESVKLAIEHRQMLVEVGKSSLRATVIPETAKLVQLYFIGLASLIKDGKYPKGIFGSDDAEDVKEFFKRLEEDR